MIDKFIKKLRQYISDKDNELMTFNLETIQGFFEMQDQNKWLRFNAITLKQVQDTDRFEEHIESILKRLYVPNYQSKNV